MFRVFSHFLGYTVLFSHILRNQIEITTEVRRPCNRWVGRKTTFSWHRADSAFILESGHRLQAVFTNFSYPVRISDCFQIPGTPLYWPYGGFQLHGSSPQRVDRRRLVFIVHLPESVWENVRLIRTFRSKYVLALLRFRKVMYALWLHVHHIRSTPCCSVPVRIYNLLSLGKAVGMLFMVRSGGCRVTVKLNGVAYVDRYSWLFYA